MSLFNFTLTRPKGLWEGLLGLFDFIKNYGVRIIVFTILLKLVLLPLDFYQKYKMKKNERITKALKPEMDKLAKAYGSDKQALSSAQMKLQRSAGFSYFATCLPMIITVLIFFSFFSGMRNISQYEEFKQYVNLYEVYSSKYLELTGFDMTEAGGGTFDPSFDYSDFDNLIITWTNDDTLTDKQKQAAQKYKTEYSSSFSNMYEDYYDMQLYVDFFSGSNIFKPTMDYTEDVKEFFVGNVFVNGVFNKEIARFDIEAITNYNGAQTAQKNNAINEIVSKANERLKEKNFSIRAIEYTDISDIVNDYQRHNQAAVIKQDVMLILDVAHLSAAAKSYEFYDQNKQNFLWIKSLWVADNSFKDAVPSFSKFNSNVSKYINGNKAKLDPQILNDINSQQTYDKVMYNIRQDKSLYSTNGYFILAVVSVGLSLLSQYVTRRQQKKSGQVTPAAGGSTMKMMMLIMPAMSAVFAILYTSAFAIYMITSSAMTLVINLLTTSILGLVYKSKQKEQLSKEGIERYGRRDPNDYINKGGKK